MLDSSPGGNIAVGEVPRVSFLICSWRAPLSLDQTLDSIYQQAPAIPYEVILVNNGFDDERANALGRRHPSLRIIDEPIQGLTHARIASFRAARGQFLVCLDDDNYLGDEFLPRFATLIAQHPQLGGICAAVIPRWETKPPGWLAEFGTCCLSYNTLEAPAPAEASFQIWRSPNLQAIRIPPGGGMIISRRVSSEYLRRIQDNTGRVALGRKGNSLRSCEDQDIYGLVFALGLDAAFSNQLQVFHQLPSSRFRLWYLVRLNYYMMKDSVLLSRIWEREGHPLKRKMSYRGNLRRALRVVWLMVKGEKAPPRAVLELVRIGSLTWTQFRTR